MIVIVILPWCLYIKGELFSLEYSLISSKKQNYHYCYFVHSEYGVLSPRNRVCSPICIVEYIFSLCPSKDGTYTGHQEADEYGDKVQEQDKCEGGVLKGSMDSSYKAMGDVATPAPCNFHAGKNGVICSLPQ